MEGHQYLPVNNEKTIFMNWDGDDFILHGILSDDLASIPTSKKNASWSLRSYMLQISTLLEGRSWTLFSDLQLGSLRMGSSFV
jgi:hypothetical protein